MPSKSLNPLPISLLLFSLVASLLPSPSHGRSTPQSSSADDSLVYLWPLPKIFRHGDRSLSVDPELALDLQIPGGESPAVSEAFERYGDLIFTQWERSARRSSVEYDVTKLTVVVAVDFVTVWIGWIWYLFVVRTHLCAFLVWGVLIVGF